MEHSIQAELSRLQLLAVRHSYALTRTERAIYVLRKGQQSINANELITVKTVLASLAWRAV